MGKGNVINAQDIYLNRLRQDKIKVNVFLMNGTRLVGEIIAFDKFTIILQDNNDKQTLIFKSGIMSMVPHAKIAPIKEKVGR